MQTNGYQQIKVENFTFVVSLEWAEVLVLSSQKMLMNSRRVEIPATEMGATVHNVITRKNIHLQNV